MTMHQRLSFWILIWTSQLALAQWQVQPSNTTANFRAISAVNDEVVWVGGTQGTVLRTTNGGKTWENKTIPDAKNLDFRGIVGFDAQTAIAMSAGPAENGQAKIYRTTDGGNSWGLVWQTTQQGVFMDGIAFWDTKRGLAFGDPIDQHWYLLQTQDGGKSWQRLTPKSWPAVNPNEAAFAASNSSMALKGNKNAWIATGGSTNGRVFRSSNRGRTWQVADTPLAANGTSGLFGLYFSDVQNGMAVGGDYKNEPGNYPNLLRTTDGGQSWTLLPKTAPTGLKEAIAVLRNELITVGPSGSGRSADGGMSWQPLTASKQGLHALGCATSRCWAVGSKGTILVIE